jgi:hypothetical protein
MSAPYLDDTTLAFAARGFIQSLSESQRDTFMSLFASVYDVDKTLSYSKEQANFELSNTHEPSAAASLLAAIRYALPRQTYASSSVAHAVMRQWLNLTSEDQERVRTTVEEGLANNNSISGEDRRIWIEVLNLNKAERKSIGQPTSFTP